eukprot:Platyproteum_vivax@DN5502_c0_g1_i1.p1
MSNQKSKIRSRHQPAEQLIGRSRMERLLDRAYVKQTVEIKKRKFEILPQPKELALPGELKPVVPELPKKIKTEVIAPQSVAEALNRVGPHFLNKKKVPKATQLFLHLIHKDFCKENATLFVDALRHLVDSNNTSHPEARKHVINIFEAFDHRRSELDAPSIEWLEIWKVRGLYSNKVYADDTFNFTSAVTKLQKIFDGLLSEYGEFGDILKEKELEIVEKKIEEPQSELVSDLKADLAEEGDAAKPPLIKHEPEDEKMPEILAPTQSQRFQLLANYFYDSLPGIFEYRNTAWAKGIVERFFQHVYLNRINIFSPQQLEQLADWQSQLKVKKARKVFAEARGVEEAEHMVKDGRDVVLNTVHGSHIWATKQVGL